MSMELHWRRSEKEHHTLRMLLRRQVSDQPVQRGGGAIRVAARVMGLIQDDQIPVGFGAQVFPSPVAYPILMNKVPFE